MTISKFIFLSVFTSCFIRAEASFLGNCQYFLTALETDRSLLNVYHSDWDRGSSVQERQWLHDYRQQKEMYLRQLNWTQLSANEISNSLNFSAPKTPGGWVAYIEIVTTALHYKIGNTVASPMHLREENWKAVRRVSLDWDHKKVAVSSRDFNRLFEAYYFQKLPNLATAMYNEITNKSSSDSFESLAKAQWNFMRVLQAIHDYEIMGFSRLLASDRSLRNKIVRRISSIVLGNSSQLRALPYDRAIEAYGQPLFLIGSASEDEAYEQYSQLMYKKFKQSNRVIRAGRFLNLAFYIYFGLMSVIEIDDQHFPVSALWITREDAVSSLMEIVNEQYENQYGEVMSEREMDFYSQAYSEQSLKDLIFRLRRLED